MSLVSYVISHPLVIYIVLNVIVFAFLTVKDYNRGVDVTLTVLLIFGLFGWWITIPILILGWVVNSLDDNFYITNTILLKSKNKKS